mgnify:CR=1 FL=1
MILPLIISLILFNSQISHELTILNLAYASTQWDCYNTVPEGYQIQGTFTYNQTTTTITNYVPVTEPKHQEVNKHELCHQKQYEEHRLYGCPFTILNEIECYQEAGE